MQITSLSAPDKPGRGADFATFLLPNAKRRYRNSYEEERIQTGGTPTRQAHCPVVEGVRNPPKDPLVAPQTPHRAYQALCDNRNTTQFS